MLKDPVKTKNEIVEWIREYFEQNGKGCKAVIGISGGAFPAERIPVLRQRCARKPSAKTEWSAF